MSYTNSHALMGIGDWGLGIGPIPNPQPSFNYHL
jgi:hypothetical protein